MTTGASGRLKRTQRTRNCPEPQPWGRDGAGTGLGGDTAEAKPILAKSPPVPGPSPEIPPGKSSGEAPPAAKGQREEIKPHKNTLKPPETSSMPAAAAQPLLLLVFLPLLSPLCHPNTGTGAFPALFSQGCSLGQGRVSPQCPRGCSDTGTKPLWASWEALLELSSAPARLFPRLGSSQELFGCRLGFFFFFVLFLPSKPGSAASSLAAQS